MWTRCTVRYTRQSLSQTLLTLLILTTFSQCIPITYRTNLHDSTSQPQLIVRKESTFPAQAIKWCMHVCVFMECCSRKLLRTPFNSDQSWRNIDSRFALCLFRLYYPPNIIYKFATLLFILCNQMHDRNIIIMGDGNTVCHRTEYEKIGATKMTSTLRTTFLNSFSSMKIL